jgi:hypothetical protein
VRGTAFVENERVGRITAQTIATGTSLVSAYADDFWIPARETPPFYARNVTGGASFRPLLQISYRDSALRRAEQSQVASATG